ncbi:MAG: N-acetylneuraminate synthase family protein [Candidatus Omnitrophica bacterium]|nr:N-acetylneuraminate synthase family protein [Candidatus Omnitrophota bacterium]
MKIGTKDTTEEVFIIAEVGNNHEGSFSLAEELVGLAAGAGASAVKFQTIIPEKLVSASQKERIQQLKKYQFSYSQFESLAKTAEAEGILFLSTPFDLESAAFLNSLVPAFKIASGDNNFFPLIDRVAQTGKPMILSSGLLGTEEVIIVRDFILNVWKTLGFRQDLAILHCVTSYPTPEAEANLLAIRILEKLGVVPGYSDHTLGIEAAVLSVACGARIIEKHFTISKTHSDFHDHRLSADPQDLAELVARVRTAEKLLGHEQKKLLSCEEAALPKVRRSITAARELAQGSVLGFEDLAWTRPFAGLAPGEESKILGKRLRRGLVLGEPIQLADVE